MASTTEQGLDTVWQTVREQFGGQGYEVVPGESNTTLLVDSDPRQAEAAYVVKVPNGDTPFDQQRSRYEADIVRRLNTSPNKSPVEIPQLLGESDDPSIPTWAAFSFVSGHVLSYDAIRENLSEQELFDLGHKVGEFALWLSQTISLETYRQVFGSPPLYNKEKLFRQAAEAAVSLDASSNPVLRRIIDAETDDFEWFREIGILRPTIVGHDDLRPGNLALKKVQGKWRLNGLFDFGITAPSTPEREMRHVRLFDGYTALHALGAYYEVEDDPTIEGPLISGTDIPAETITSFWAYTQALTNAIWRMKYGADLGSIPLKLDRLFTSHYDWSEFEGNPDWAQKSASSMLDLSTCLGSI
jgi:aminoglycoside phosphotransferase (APT) family kinase protein